MASNREKLDTPEYKARLLAFSKILKLERGKLGIKQGELAKCAGLSGHAVISRWEAVANPERNKDDGYTSTGAVARELPDVNDLLSLCAVFGCDIDYLLGMQALPKKANTDISEKTGLEEKGVNGLISIWEQAQQKRNTTGGANQYLDAIDRQSPFVNAHGALKKLLWQDGDGHVPNGLRVLNCINLYLKASGFANINDFAYGFSDISAEAIALTAVTEALTLLKQVQKGGNNSVAEENKG